MWERYRKTAPTTQAFIIICCVLMHFVTKSPSAMIAFAFVAMEIGAVLGAFWTNRLLKKMEEQQRNASKK
jgi:hypothetical protein